ncbi:hypothetical protein EVAR_85801_1 [Eumeta japonica]|uniref:Reverse transcriptase domain-containing protein n=1 Tax=Eumeta variegata TaxID=151549 RepID=A0A4C1URK0_EUMVA|nr:hypothetical protein EVAR_85801_1 [Eumeta japonica]
MDELSVKCLLYTDDQIIIAPSACELKEMVNKKNVSLKKRCMKANVGKTKVMVFEGGESTTECDILIEGEDIERRVSARNKVNGALLAFIDSKSISRKERLAIRNEVLIPTLMNGTECWVWQKKNESRINAVVIRSLRSMCGASWKDRCRNSYVRERCGLKEDVVTRVGRGMLRWFGRQKMNESSLIKQIYRVNVCDGKVGEDCPRKSYAVHIVGISKDSQILSF